jgi:hypothetical protein
MRRARLKAVAMENFMTGYPAHEREVFIAEAVHC